MKKSKFIDEKVIIKGEGFGIMFGTLIDNDHDSKSALLKNVRLLYYYSGACSTLELSTKGVTNPNACKFSTIVEEIEVVNYDSIMKCTDLAITNIENVEEWSTQE